MKHILICGERHVGKSTLVKRLIENTDVSVYGFLTKSLNVRDDGFHEIFMMPAGRSGTPVRLACCNTIEHHVEKSVFDGYGLQLLSEVKDDGIIVMDELGFMEDGCKGFTSRVLDLLDGSIPVIATVKSTHPNVEFLNRVRSHPNTERYDITESNRDELYEQLRKKDIFHKARQS